MRVVFLMIFLFSLQLPEEVCVHGHLSFLEMILTKICFILSTKKSKLLRRYFLSFCSTLALRECTWRKTSSSPAVQQLVLRPLSTCARCAAAFVFPLGSTSSFPLPLNQTRTQTFIYGYSLRKTRISSKFTAQSTRPKPQLFQSLSRIHGWFQGNWRFCRVPCWAGKITVFFFLQLVPT